jgi:hypothetical protein
MHMGIPVCKRVGIAKKFAYGDPRTQNEVVRIRGLTHIPNCMQNCGMRISPSFDPFSVIVIYVPKPITSSVN